MAPKYNRYQRGLAYMVYNFSDEKTSDSGSAMRKNEQLAKELHKAVVRKFKKRRAYSSVKENIWRFYLADIQLTSKFNKGMRFFLCVIDIFSKYSWAIPLKKQKGYNDYLPFSSYFK